MRGGGVCGGRRLPRRSSVLEPLVALKEQTPPQISARQRDIRESPADAQQVHRPAASSFLGNISGDCNMFFFFLLSLC